jgi:hypothetical protein
MKHATFIPLLFCFLSLYPLLCYPGICGSTLIKRPSLITLPNPSFPLDEEETKNQEEDDSKGNDINEVANTNSFFAKKGIPQAVEYIMYDFLDESYSLENIGKTAKENCIPKEYFYIKKQIVLKNKKPTETNTDEEVINYLRRHLQPSEMTNSRIERIELDDYPITLTILNFIATTFPNLKILKIRDANTSEDGTFTYENLKSLGALTNLTHLELDGSFYTDESFKALGTLKDLKKLTFLKLRGKNNIFTDEDLNSFSALNNLTHLEIDGNNNFTDEGLKALSTLKKLTRLKLGGKYNIFTDESLKSLSVLENLTHLVLYGDENRFTDEGFTALSILTKISHLELDGHIEFTDEGLKSLNHLTHLVLFGSNNIFTDEDLGNLRTLSNLTHLKLKVHYNKLTDEGLKSLGALKNLTHLELDGFNTFTDEGLKYLGALTKLTFVKLQGINYFTNIGLKHLGTLENLTHLMLYGDHNRFTDEGLKHLGTLENLTHLVLFGNDNGFTSIGLEHLGTLTKLTDR